MSGEAATQADGTEAQPAQGQPPAATQTPPAAGPAQAAPAQPAAFDFTKVIGPDGKFLDGWKKGLPEEFQHELSLDTYDSIPELAKQHLLAQKMIGKNKIVMPTDKSTPAEWDAFYNAIGRPKSPGEYKFTPPTDLNLVDLSPEFVNPIFSDLHKAGATQKVLDVAMGHFTGFIKNLEKSIEEAEQKNFDEAERIIKEGAGDALEDQQHQANLLIAENCPSEEYKAKLLEAINDNALRPYVFNFLANIRQKIFGTHGGIPAGDGQAGSAMTPAAMESKAQELMATPGYMDGTLKNTNPAGYKRLTDEITELYRRAGSMKTS